jgi:hypothetical protein
LTNNFNSDTIINKQAAKRFGGKDMDTVTTYETGIGLKHVEQDIFNDGCQPDTAITFEANEAFVANSIEVLINEIKTQFDVTDESLLLDSCEEKGRIDVQTLETDDGIKASDRDIDSWKKGEKRLWMCTYSYNVQKVTRETISIV